jgi:hypothetical protein
VVALEYAEWRDKFAVTHTCTSCVNRRPVLRKPLSRSALHLSFAKILFDFLQRVYCSLVHVMHILSLGNVFIINCTEISGEHFNIVVTENHCSVQTFRLWVWIDIQCSNPDYFEM